MRIVITGADGFLGKNLMLQLEAQAGIELIHLTRNDNPGSLPERLKDADVVFHLAGVNRPQNPEEFHTGNAALTQILADATRSAIRRTGRSMTIVYASSTQATLDNPYGRSKREAEDALIAASQDPGLRVCVFRLPNVFGKWSRPNYNSVVATFCHNIARDLPIQINAPDAPLTLVYVDDVMAAFLRVLRGHAAARNGHEMIEVKPLYQTTVGELAQHLRGFRDNRNTLKIDRVGQGLIRALYATYVSYLPVEAFAYAVPRHTDPRGTFVEMLKTPDAGQFSFFTARPGMTRGGHYHHSKTEKFLVIKGNALFRFKHMQTGQKHQINTSGEIPEIVETVPGWTHDITNVGSDDLIVMLWANEQFDPELPDTYKCVID